MIKETVFIIAVFVLITIIKNIIVATLTGFQSHYHLYMEISQMVRENKPIVRARRLRS